MKISRLTHVFTFLAQGRIFYPVPAPAPEELLIGPYQKTVPPGMGLCLLVPPETCVVVVTGKTRRTLQEGPQWLDLSAGPYQLYTVSRRKHFLSLNDLSVSTADSHTVMISLDLDWEATIPEIVTRVPQPLTRLEALCRSAVARIANRYTHDQLVGAPGSPVKLHEQLADEISALLKRSRHSTGITVSNPNLQKLVGDARIMQPRMDKAAAIEQGEAARRAAEIHGATAQLEAEVKFIVAQLEHQKQLIPELRKQAYQDRFQERQWRQQRVTTAMKSLTQLASGLFQNTSQEMIIPEFQPFPLIIGDALVKVMEAILAEFSRLALASPLAAEMVNEEERIKSYKRMLQELSAIEGAPQPAGRPVLRPINGNPAKVSDLSALPRAE